jgi:hypothetical protein
MTNIPVRARLRTADGRIIKVRSTHLQHVRLGRDPDTGGWVARVKHGRTVDTFTGPEAEQVTRVLLPAINQMAGSRAVIRQAVADIEQAGDPEAYVGAVAATLPPYDPGAKVKAGLLHKLPTPTRLALEMALHEEQERRALAGELLDLEQAWRQAEEIAAIADNLLVPPEHEERIRRRHEELDAEHRSPPDEKR